MIWTQPKKLQRHHSEFDILFTIESALDCIAISFIMKSVLLIKYIRYISLLSQCMCLCRAAEVCVWCPWKSCERIQFPVYFGGWKPE